MTLSTFLTVFIIVFIAMVPLSLIVETLRPKPKKPDEINWGKDIPIQYIDLDGTKVRYIKIGNGPTLVLLHTLRTQLDIFQKMIPELSKSFTVYAVDFPGHGWSDIPKKDYTLDFFVDSVERFLVKLDLHDVIFTGVSIGGSIPLVIAGKNNKRIKGVISLNPYDYDGKGPARGNLVANFFMSIIFLPILGETFMRMRIRIIEKIIFQGGVYDPNNLPASFLEECFVVGERPGYLAGFINLIRNSRSFVQAHDSYKTISVPTLVIYGEKDWATQEDRDKTLSAIPDAELEIINESGHFITLEKPELLNNKIKEFVQKIT